MITGLSLALIPEYLINLVRIHLSISVRAISQQHSNVLILVIIKAVVGRKVGVHERLPEPYPQL